MHRAYVLTRYVLSEDGTDNGSFVDGFAFCVLLPSSVLAVGSLLAWFRLGLPWVPTWKAVFPSLFVPWMTSACQVLGMFSIESNDVKIRLKLSDGKMSNTPPKSVGVASLVPDAEP